ncbi:hypothetical protein SAMD00019534_103150 [Acytostelium subglobosum LB1]|uniref:hypothetical protein n=1 Tax=Acytostelium subglobosum LB1 TaxID=1410327 RepID=UPI000645048A|nr:hypothetical protein SAMD00019534_103150 [Acytostelium subglobosum LB1]GAM27140.1 hypothetical protein SAMD00019534_103150 [Acytostelium subglobosum LB1]|eukprot:XP_012750020.1 hypothetical protein SAMD00019534_103150 [Acytostelium subglobosum LB1]
MLVLPKIEVKDIFLVFYILLVIPKLIVFLLGLKKVKVMSVRELFPFFKWGFNIRRSNFLVPILSNNIIVTGEEAVSFEKPLPEPLDIASLKLCQNQKLQLEQKLQQQQQHQASMCERELNLEELIQRKEASLQEAIVSQPVEQKHQAATIAPAPANTIAESQSEQSEQAGTPNRNLLASPIVAPAPAPATPVPSHSISSMDGKPLLSSLSNEEILAKTECGDIPLYKLEVELGDCSRAVEIRRMALEKKLDKTIEEIPHLSYDFAKVLGACCENVIGYVPIPVGTAGPLLLNNEEVTIPMATTEGCLVASTHRGCRAISESGGARAVILSRGMTRAPVVRFPSIDHMTDFTMWLKEPQNYEIVKKEFDSTSRFARLTGLKITVAGRSVHLRFKCDTGDAMGMNMVTKGVEAALNMLKIRFNLMEIISLSGNMCTDKKPSSMNWIDGRGRTVVAEAVISGDIIKRVLKTSVSALVDLNISKNLVGSAMTGSIGGFNAHASNIVTAVFLATGQDCAQNVESSNCITLMESCNDGQDLYITVTMPSIEVGTVGGGTFLPAQSACLNIIGVKGSKPGKPGHNADQLAKTVCAAVMAGELSLMSALSAGHLMKSHLQLNRKTSSICLTGQK